jgi:hypothetical protein
MIDDKNDPMGLKFKKMLERERTMKDAPKDKRRDVWLHGAVTIMNEQGTRIVPFENENEIGQFAVTFDFRKVPVPEVEVKKAFDDMRDRLLVRMRAYGLLK